jgi:exodeoxyribonuclease I
VLAKNEGYQKLKLHKELVDNHWQKLKAATGFDKKLLAALEIMWPKRQTGLVDDPLKVDGQLYEGFVPNSDREKMSVVRAAKPEELSNLSLDFKDSRLKLLLPLYAARNYPKTLDGADAEVWEAFRRNKLVDSGQVQKFFSRLEEIAATPGIEGQKQYLLEELNLYAQAIIPAG